MKTTAKTVYMLGLILTGAFVLLCTGFYTYALLTDYSSLLAHFGKSAFTDIFLPLLYILAIVTFAVFGIIYRSALTAREYKSAIPSVCASGFAALTTAIWLITFAPSLLSGGTFLLQTVFGILTLIAGLFMLAYLVLSSLPGAVRNGTVLCGTFAILFPLAYAFFAYFDSAFALNSPVKIFDQVAMIAFLFFLVAEMRLRFGAVSEAVFLPLSMIATVLTGTGSISGLIYMAVEGRPLYASIMHDFLLFGFFLYSLTRLLAPLLSMAPATPAKESHNEPDVQRAFPSHRPTDYAQESFDFDQSAEAEPAAQPEEPVEEPAEEEEELGASADVDIEPTEG